MANILTSSITKSTVNKNVKNEKLEKSLKLYDIQYPVWFWLQVTVNNLNLP